MGYDETIEIINYAKDLEIEYNLKLFLLFITFAYCVCCLFLAYKWQSDKYYVKVIKNFLIYLPFSVIMFFYPLFSIILLRGVSWEVFYMMVVAFYGYSLIVLLISAKLGIFEYAMDLLGIKPKIKEMKL